MIARPLPFAAAAACLLVATVVAGCSSPARPEAVKTVTVTPSRSPSAPSSSVSSSPSASATPAQTTLPGTCDSMLPLSSVDTALGRSITGETAFVVGVAEADIGRLSYLNCRYGLPAGAAAKHATPKIEIGLSLYDNDADAAKRIPITVADYGNHNAAQSKVTVGDVPASILTGGAGAGYQYPTLVAASGQRTIAITVAERAGAQATKDLTALAKLALSVSAG